MSRFASIPLTGVILFLLGSFFLITGCSDKDDPVQVEQDPITEPDTATQMMVRFRTAYETRDAGQYLALLDPEFRFILQPETIYRIPDLGTALDFAEEERIHQRMFSGEAVIDPQGELRPAVVTIEFLEFRALDAWSDSDGDGLFPDAVWAPFAVDLVFDCGPTFSTFNVSGVVKVFARAHSQMVGELETTHYLMAGMVDLTNFDKGVESTPWGLIKAFYR